MSELTYQDVLRILDLVNASDCINFEFEGQGMRIKVERNSADRVAPARQTVTAAPKPAGPSAPSSAQEPDRPKTSAARAEFPDATAVNAPMTGVFYAAPAPGKPPFVEVGSEVKQGDQLGIIEVMKLFTPITAPSDGVVVSILVENQETVAKDAALVLLETK